MSLSPTTATQGTTFPLSRGAIIGIAFGTAVLFAILGAVAMHYFGRGARIANAKKNAQENYLRMNGL